MTLLGVRGVAPQDFALTLHETIGTDGTHISTAFATKIGRFVTVSFALYGFVDREAVIGQEPIVYLPDALKPADVFSGRYAPGVSGPWYTVSAFSVLGASYPRSWLRLVQPSWAPPGGDYPPGIYEDPSLSPEVFSPMDGEERVECVGGFTYLAAA